MAEADAVRFFVNNAVEGWLRPSAAETSLLLLRHIQSAGRPTCEIGVHQGKYAIFLAAATGGRFVGYDLFEARQDENVDASGKGDREIFLGNAKRHKLSADQCSAIAVNSLDLTGERVVADCGGQPVFFSVDGGHTADLTENDLFVAQAAISDDGIVALDDVFNEAWPGVLMGLARYLDRESSALVPCAISGGKVFLAKGEARAADMAMALRGNRKTDIGYLTRREDKLFEDWPVTVLHERVSTKTLLEGFQSTDFWMNFRRSPIYKTLKGVRA